MASSPNTTSSVAERLRARRMRVARIRKRALAAAGGTFALAWGVIFFQLASGHDPALAKHTTASAISTNGSVRKAVKTSSSGSTSTASTGSSSTSLGSTGSASTSSSASSSPVTTSQS